MRWTEVLEDRQLGELPYKIELDQWGNVVMSPASNLHGYLQTVIAMLLMKLRSDGAVLTECSIETSKGVKVADTVWGSKDFFARNQLATPFVIAPEVCVEVLSPSNSMDEMREKKDLYLARGAREVWVCDDRGKMTFFAAAGEVASSRLVPDFPPQLKITLPGVDLN
jgi:Uma2 family endonuclease